VSAAWLRALKFSDNRPIEVAAERGERTARIVVRDHGLGIPLEDQARIFGRFERASSTPEVGGLGLGLYITREIVKVTEAPSGWIAGPARVRASWSSFRWRTTHRDPRGRPRKSLSCSLLFVRRLTPCGSNSASEVCASDERA
jgi:hypothetical protein